MVNNDRFDLGRLILVIIHLTTLRLLAGIGGIVLILTSLNYLNYLLVALPVGIIGTFAFLKSFWVDRNFIGYIAGLYSLQPKATLKQTVAPTTQIQAAPKKDTNEKTSDQ